jgi:glycosyltransferase involved in cell wall biosynthesis
MPRIVIGIAYYNTSQPLAVAVDSALKQKVLGYNIVVLVLDSSVNVSASSLLRNKLKVNRLHIVRGRAKSAYAARNRLINYAESKWGDLSWHVRLDPDDCFTSIDSLAKIFSSISPGHLVVLAGNRQISSNNQIIGYNIPSSKLLNKSYLLGRLSRMAKGDFSSELPSCNLILKAGYRWKYPAKKSAEDHWMLVCILLKIKSKLIYITKKYLIDYKLGGSLTSLNLNNGKYIKERVKLLEEATALC